MSTFKKKRGFSEVLKSNAKVVKLNPVNKSFVFPSTHLVSTIGVTETSSSTDYPTILEGFNTVHQFLAKDENETVQEFEAMLRENEELAIRFMLWMRDARNGGGVRDAGRYMLNSLSYHPNLKNIIEKIPVLGRFDDLLLDWKSERAMRMAVERFTRGFADDNEKGLACKWAPRRGIWEYRLRKEMGMTPQDYRKFLVAGSKTVEQSMCSGDWSNINYSQVPSKAHSIYRGAFLRHNPKGYEAFIKDVESGANDAKINAGVIAPHEIGSKVTSINGQVYRASIDAQFKAIPYDLGELTILPIVDVSPSMKTAATKSLSCKSIASSLGLYIAQNQTGFLEGLILSFSEVPKILNYKGKGFSDAFMSLQDSDWGMYTDLTASMKEVYKMAKRKNADESSLPDVLLILSDMDFNGQSMMKGKGTQNQANQLNDLAREYGFTKVPAIIFWNLSSSGGKVKTNDVDQNGVINISGFSPKILGKIGDIISGQEVFSTDTALLDVLMDERYNFL
jgi:hypothetical protein